jgi:hypothetical protein
MKRRLILVLAIAGILLCVGVVLSYTHVLAATLNVKWSYDYSSQPACSKDRQTNCIDHFEILDYTDQGKPKLLRAVPNPQGATSKAENISETFSYGPPFGLRTIVVIAVARDKQGDRVTSNPFAARRDVNIWPKMSSKPRQSDAAPTQ